MFTIGDFARQGRVSVRMLRHYDAIGLLRPSYTDERSGYRFYAARQLSRLNRVVALKDLGFTLEQVATILDEKLGVAELAGMLRLRRAELQNRIADDTARLEQIEARIRLIEVEGYARLDDVQVKCIPALRVAELTGTADDLRPDAVGPVVGPLFDELCARVSRSAVVQTGPTLAYYEIQPPDGEVVVHAAVPVEGVPSSLVGLTIVDLPVVERAASIVHRGPMRDVLTTVQTLARWMDANNERSGPSPYREVYLDASEDETSWVTELQEPLL